MNKGEEAYECICMRNICSTQAAANYMKWKWHYRFFLQDTFKGNNCKKELCDSDFFYFYEFGINLSAGMLLRASAISSAYFIDLLLVRCPQLVN